jgi:adenine deaminase
MDQRLLAVARGDGAADVVLRGGRVLSVFTGEALDLDVAVVGDRIAAVAPDLEGERVESVDGAWVVPGLIDAHVHLESSMVTPLEFARAVVPRGTTTVVCDPHELANVCGAAGVRWLLDASEGLPLTVYANAPSCVPATHMATAGAELGVDDLAMIAAHPRVLGLAEVMNVPGVVLGDPRVHDKIEAFRDQPVDGHAPGLTGPWLQAYLAAGIGTDHESLTADEAREKLRLGMRVWLRESTGAKNLRDLLPVVTPETVDRCGFCTDDRHPYDLQDEGHLDHLVRLAVAEGLDPRTAVRMATLSVAEFYGLTDRGAVAPGRRADLVIVEDLGQFRPRQVWSGGELVSEGGAPVGRWHEPRSGAAAVRVGVRVDPEALDFRIEDRGVPVRVIGMVPDQIVTTAETREMPSRDGLLQADPVCGVAKLAVVERYRGTGTIGLGFLEGLGLERGALAGTVAHDHHNLVVAGMDDVSMQTAAEALTEADGGMVVTEGGEVLGLLPLPLAGLMSEQSLAEVRRTLDELIAATRELGCEHPDPFMALGFMALEVIPALKLTDQGLVDVNRFELVSIYSDRK